MSTVLGLLAACSLPAKETPAPVISAQRSARPVQATLQPSATPELKAAIPPTQQATAVPIITPTMIPAFQICSPLEGVAIDELTEIISDPYHPPPMGKDERHQGVDFSYYRRGERLSIQGSTIQSVLPGRVAASIIDSFPFGNFVIIETREADLPPEVRQSFGILEGESLYVLYGHMEGAPGVRVGDPVQACRALGQVGKSGNAGVAHLHLETRHGPANTQFPVMAYYLAQNTPEERVNYLRWATSGEFLHFDPMVLLALGSSK